MVRQDHCFCGGSRAVIVRSVADVHAGEQADQALELEDRLERALGNFGLIRSVRRIKLTALQEVIHRCGDVVLVCAGTQETDEIAGGGVG